MTPPTEAAIGRTCPDGGTCHHSCGHSCWRVQTCEPLGPWEQWPPDVVAANPPDPAPRVEDALVGGLGKPA